MKFKYIKLPNTEEIEKTIKDNDGYCVCALYKTPDTKCMCKQFRENDDGICHCGLYIKQSI